VSRGAVLIAAERLRQIGDEGWTAEHDAQHSEGELALAGAAYALSAVQFPNPPEWWPWAAGWWKPDNPLRDLVKAGALIAAEIDRRLAEGEPDRNAWPVSERDRADEEPKR